MVRSLVQPSKKSGVALLATGKHSAEHELCAHKHLAKKIAQLLGLAFYDTAVSGAAAPPNNLYLVPDDTLVTRIHSQPFGIHSIHDFFGGMVAQPVLATKAITHPLFKNGDQSPTDWPILFSQKVSDAVLKGYTVFTLNDVQRAGSQLLLDGPVRVKSVRACAGRGQHLVTNGAELTALIATLDETEVAAWGLVLEENLQCVSTYSVGQVNLGELTISYVGTQSTTRANDGDTVYGGSKLLLVRGDYDDLLTLNLPTNTQLAIAQARTYEEAAFAHIPGFIASRRNYDVAQGINDQGKLCSGVLEQSWRIGGASGAEVYALEAFARDPSLSVIQASTCEIYGATELPPHTAVLYRGEDAQVGFISKLVTVEPYGNANADHQHRG
jgi:hypothetical protein